MSSREAGDIFSIEPKSILVIGYTILFSSSSLGVAAVLWIWDLRLVPIWGGVCPEEGDGAELSAEFQFRLCLSLSSGTVTLSLLGMRTPPRFAKKASPSVTRRRKEPHPPPPCCPDRIRHGRWLADWHGAYIKLGRHRYQFPISVKS